EAGSFVLDVKTLPSLRALDAALEVGDFTQSRAFRVRNGNVLVDGIATVHIFDLSADSGAITVSGAINASGAVGGSIDLAAHGDVTLLAGANLSVAGSELDDAGKGGTIALETTNGRIGIRFGSTLDLSVANHAGGTLHLRAPQTFDADAVAIDPLLGNIHNATSIIAEGFFAQDANPPGVALIDDMESVAHDNANEFMTHLDDIQTRLVAGNSSLGRVLQVLPGEEIDNSQGGLI